MMLNPLIRQETDRLITEKRQIVELRHELTFERMLNELGKIALADIGKVVKWRYVRAVELPANAQRHARPMIHASSAKADSMGDGEISPVTVIE